MRIISEFHDYYDSVQAEGQDQTVVWVRKPEERKFRRNRNDQLPEYPFPVFRHGYGYLQNEKIVVDQYVIGFCGKIYPLLKLSLRMVWPEVASYCYTIDEVDAYVNEHLDEREAAEYYRTKGFGKWYKRKIPGKRKDYLEFFEECRQKQEQYQNWFVENRCPVFVASISRYDAEITLNTPLKQFEFYRMFDVYTAFQEIAMYFGGVLGGIREYVPPVDDKTLAQAKGFDKWSFRKPPQN